MSRRVKLILLAVLTAGWMGVIFWFSGQDGEASSASSGRAVRAVIAVIEPEFDSLSRQRQDELTGTVTFCIRKGAHFTEYFILGLLLFLLFREWEPPFMRSARPGLWLWAWLAGTLYAASDEFHQTFSGGRSPQVRDVCLDCAGVICGILAALAALRLAGRWRKKRLVKREGRG